MAATSTSRSRSRNAVWPSLCFRGVVELAGECFGGGGESQVGEMAAQLLIGRVVAHDAVPRRARRRRPGRRRRRRPSGPSRRAASASAAAPGGRFALRSHGRAVVNADSTTRLERARGARRCARSPRRPAGASRCARATAPAGEWISTVAAAEPMPQRHARMPVSPGGTE